MNTHDNDDALVIAGRRYGSRLLVGTGKYKDLDETGRAIGASGAEIVTVAVRRTNLGQSPGEPNLLDVLDPARYTILPNTAGCYDAETAVRTSLAAPIGSGLGIQNRYTLREIIEQAKVPVIVDAGVGTASDAAIAMELGCDAVLMNTAIAEARDPVMMAEAMRHAIVAGRLAYRAGRMPRRTHASASSPVDGRFHA